MSEEPLSLVADIGATNARFGLAGPDGVHDIEILHGAQFPSLEAAAAAYLRQVKPPLPPRRAAVAIAGPVIGDSFSLTNLAWSFSIDGVCSALDLDRLKVVNDFTAVALSVPHLTAADRTQVGGGTAEPGSTIGVIGPGSGLGVSAVVPSRDRWIPLAGEGGHVTMAAVTDREAEVLRHLRRRFNHVSAERVVSGMGLANLHQTLAAIDGDDDVRMREPKEIADAALARTDPACVEAVEMFCAMLGTVAGNLALSLGSVGGVFIAGGIVPKLGPVFERSPFRDRFEAKGRMRDYVARIPTFVITHPLPAFIGLRSLLEE